MDLVNPDRSTLQVLRLLTRDEAKQEGKVYVVSTIAGMKAKGHRDGKALNDALFNAPEGIRTDRGKNVYVADNGNHCIQKMTPNVSNSIQEKQT